MGTTVTLPVAEVLQATPRSRIIRIALGGRPFAFAEGQACMVGLAGSTLKKPYSIASAPFEAARTGTIELLTRIEDALLDPHLERAQPGTLLDIEGPFGTFGLSDAAEPTLLVAGGTGIAPLRSMVVEWLAAGARALSLVYCARTPDDLAYRLDLESRAERGRLSVMLVVSRPAEAWSGRVGRLDEALLREALPAPGARCVACGPPGFIGSLRALLPRVGVGADRLHTQRA